MASTGQGLSVQGVTGKGKSEGASSHVSQQIERSAATLPGRAGTGLPDVSLEESDRQVVGRTVVGEAVSHRLGRLRVCSGQTGSVSQGSYLRLRAGKLRAASRHAALVLHSLPAGVRLCPRMHCLPRGQSFHFIWHRACICQGTCTHMYVCVSRRKT